MKTKGLSVLLTACVVFLVGSCGASGPDAPTAPSAPDYWVLDRFRVPEFGGEVMVICRNRVMYVVSDVYTGIEAQRIGYEKECA